MKFSVRCLLTTLGLVHSVAYGAPAAQTAKPPFQPAPKPPLGLTLNAFLDQQGQIFSQIDADHDGLVSSKEFADYRTHLERERLIKQYQSLFANLDANHDGVLSGEEFMKLATNPRIPDPKPQFDLLDTNHDGRVSRSEYLLRVTAHFDRLDFNKDGTIDASELARSQQSSPGR